MSKVVTKPKLIYKPINEYFFKISTLGSFGSGKTTIVRNFLQNNQWPKPILLEPSNDIDKTLEINKIKVSLKCHDTYGMEDKYGYTISRHFYRCNGILLVYDITSRESFNQLHKWIEETKCHSPLDTQIMIIGNKGDLESNRQVLYEEGLELSNVHSFQFMEISAFSNKNVNDCFLTLINNIIKDRKRKEINDNPKSNSFCCIV